jgi:hypothetical protein
VTLSCFDFCCWKRRCLDVPTPTLFPVGCGSWISFDAIPSNSVLVGFVSTTFTSN